MVNVFIWLIGLDLVWPKVIPLSGAQCIWIVHHTKNKTFPFSKTCSTINLNLIAEKNEVYLTRNHLVSKKGRSKKVSDIEKGISKSGTSKSETSKSETSKNERSISEKSIRETSKKDKSKSEKSKSKTSKIETSKIETSKSETSKSETSKSVTSQSETSPGSK